MKSLCLGIVQDNRVAFGWGMLHFMERILGITNGLIRSELYANKLPRVADEVPGVAGRDVLCDEQAGEDALEVLVGLRSVRRERRSRFCGVGREEAGDRIVEDRAVEVVCGQGPLRQEHRRHRIAANRYRKYFYIYIISFGHHPREYGS
jgi:hypothetical protein